MEERFEEHLKYCREVGCYSTGFFTGGVAGGYYTQQNPWEFAKLLTFLEGIRPIQRYLEIGSASGGFIRTIHERVGFDSALMMDAGLCQIEMQEPNIAAFKDKIRRYIVDSHSSEAQQILSGEAPFDFIFIDGDHSYEGVMKDVHLVLPYASESTVIGFHDIHYQDDNSGVNRAYAELVRTGKLKEICQFVDPKANRPLGIGLTRK